MPRLIDISDDLRKKNLYDTEEPPLAKHNGPAEPAVREDRATDGGWNDLKCPHMGATGARFGRNFPLAECFPDTANLLNPSPRTVSRELMTGLYAEPLPDGFGFSETAFRIFVPMASRRLKSDRFFTDDYRPEVCPQEGLEWVKSNSMLTALKRHLPGLAKALDGLDNAFKPWKAVEQIRSAAGRPHAASSLAPNG